MMILVYGGSASGKSEYAEELITAMESDTRYYIATMQAKDDESIRRINSHKDMRRDKRFTTVERSTDIDLAPIKESGSGLLECMTNLLANEMFLKSGIVDSDRVSEKIVSDTLRLNKRLDNLVIVSGNVSSAGADYDEYTLDYIRALELINTKIAEAADRVYEVVCGIPIKIK